MKTTRDDIDREVRIEKTIQRVKIIAVLVFEILSMALLIYIETLIYMDMEYYLVFALKFGIITLLCQDIIKNIWKLYKTFKSEG